MKVIQSMFYIFISLVNSQTYFTGTSLKNHSYIENPDNTGLIVACSVLTAILSRNACYFLEQNWSYKARYHAILILDLHDKLNKPCT